MTTATNTEAGQILMGGDLSSSSTGSFPELRATGVTPGVYNASASAIYTTEGNPNGLVDITSQTLVVDVKGRIVYIKPDSMTEAIALSNPDVFGIVKPDNASITIANDGILTSGLGSVGIATSSVFGSVMPDNITIDIDNNSTLYINKTSSSQVGLAKPDNTTINLTNSKLVATLPTATSSTYGIVKPNNTNIVLNENDELTTVSPNASVNSIGLVKPDNTTITISNGIISSHILPANNITLGLVKPDNTTMTINAGVLSSKYNLTEIIPPNYTVLSNTFNNFISNDSPNINTEQTVVIETKVLDVQDIIWKIYHKFAIHQFDLNLVENIGYTTVLDFSTLLPSYSSNSTIEQFVEDANILLNSYSLTIGHKVAQDLSSLLDNYAVDISGTPYAVNAGSFIAGSMNPAFEDFAALTSISAATALQFINAINGYLNAYIIDNADTISAAFKSNIYSTLAKYTTTITTLVSPLESLLGDIGNYDTLIFDIQQLIENYTSLNAPISNNDMNFATGVANLIYATIITVYEYIDSYWGITEPNELYSVSQYTLPPTTTPPTPSLGIAKPDGITLSVTNGVLSDAIVNATTTVAGYSRPDNSSITLVGDKIVAAQYAVATPLTHGLVKVDGTTITASGSVLTAIYPTATSTTLGVVKSNVSVFQNFNGVLSTIPATSSTLGVVKFDTSIKNDSNILSTVISDNNNFGVIRVGGNIRITTGNIIYLSPYNAILGDINYNLTGDLYGYGLVQGGSAISINNGVISARSADTIFGYTGIVKPDNSTIQVVDGTLSLTTTGYLHLGSVNNFTKTQAESVDPAVIGTLYETSLYYVFKGYGTFSNISTSYEENANANGNIVYIYPDINGKYPYTSPSGSVAATTISLTSKSVNCTKARFIIKLSNLLTSIKVPYGKNPSNGYVGSTMYDLSNQPFINVAVPANKTYAIVEIVSWGERTVPMTPSYLGYYGNYFSYTESVTFS